MTLEELAYEIHQRYYEKIGENTIVYGDSPFMLVISHATGEMHIININGGMRGW